MIAPMRPLIAAAALGALAACTRPAPVDAPLPQQAVRPDSAAFVTLLGSDTLAVERIVRRPGIVEAEVLLRTPRTTLTRYTLRTAADGGLQELTSESTAPAVRRERVTRMGDSLRIETTTGDSVRARSVAAEGAVLPFIDMVHWPFELALARLRSGPSATLAQPLLSGQRVSAFTFARRAGDTVTITHPTRGTMQARADAAGRLLWLDAGSTTRKLTVERRPWLSISDLAASWRAQDAAGRSFGALSGRGGDTAVVQGATITVDYGRPEKRGREIWGRLVPYGQVWRTGANMATHFTTTRTLLMGSGGDTLRVPAGSYTLFSIPAANGGVLIVNRQTGQTGTAYDGSRDLGRVPFRVVPLAEAVEVFAIEPRPTAGGGELWLLWDRRALVVPFTVQ